MYDGITTISFSGSLQAADFELSLESKEVKRPRGAVSHSPTVSVGNVGGAARSVYFAGPENALVAAAVQAVRDGSSPRYNPLVLCGPSGIGKSLLAWGLAGEFAARRQGDVVCLTGADFARQTSHSQEAAALARVRQRIRDAALCVLDDVAYLAGKPTAQQELLHTLDERIAEEQPVIVTSQLPPRQSPRFMPGLAARLSAGLEITLAPPGPAARRAILEHVAQQRDIALPADAAQILAEELVVMAPELAGALAELDAHCRAEKTPLTAVHARQYAKKRPTSGASVKGIAAATARYFGLRVTDLTSPSRRRGVVQARGVAVYLARQLTGKSLEQLGRHFGRRDHTTILHGYRTTEQRVQTDPATRQAVSELRKMVLT